MIQDPRLAEYPETTRKPFCSCDVCGETIYYDDEYYDFDGDEVCENCVDDYIWEHFKKTAEEEI